jgi:hypothetical protein
MYLPLLHHHHRHHHHQLVAAVAAAVVAQVEVEAAAQVEAANSPYPHSVFITLTFSLKPLIESNNLY